MTEAPPRVLFLAADDRYFLLHRLALARAARAAGFEVAVAAPDSGAGARIASEGCAFHPIALRRRNVNPLRAGLDVIRMVRVCRAVRPDLLHAVAVKPILIGALAARIARVPATVAAFTGLGYVFTARTMFARALRPLVTGALRWLLSAPSVHVLAEHEGDAETLARTCGVARARVTVIPGSGVDAARFAPRPEPEAAPVTALLAARMLWDKGIGEFVEAARMLAARGAPVRCVLAGAPDRGASGAIPEAQLRRWHDDGVVAWLGLVEDMPELIARSHIAVLPSCYGEGVPMFLLEAAATGRPLVATARPGLTDIARADETGLVVPPRDPAALAGAIERLARDPALRRTLGRRGRALVEARFSSDRVAAATLAVYRKLGVMPPARG